MYVVTSSFILRRWEICSLHSHCLYWHACERLFEVIHLFILPNEHLLLMQLIFKPTIDPIHIILEIPKNISFIISTGGYWNNTTSSIPPTLNIKTLPPLEFDPEHCMIVWQNRSIANNFWQNKSYTVYEIWRYSLYFLPLSLVFLPFAFFFYSPLRFLWILSNPCIYDFKRESSHLYSIWNLNGRKGGKSKDWYSDCKRINKLYAKLSCYIHSEILFITYFC